MLLSKKDWIPGPRRTQQELQAFIFKVAERLEDLEDGMRSTPADDRPAGSIEVGEVGRFI